MRDGPLQVIVIMMIIIIMAAPTYRAPAVTQTL